MRKKKAIMIGAGLANMAGAVYLIQEGNWDGKDITFYALDTHGANDGSTASEAAEEYWNKNHPMENTKGFIARGGRMLNYRTYVDLMDLLDRIPSVTEPGMTAAEDTRDFDSKHRTYDKARLLQGGKGIVDGHKLGLNNLDRILLSRLVMMPDNQEEKLDNVTIAEYFEDSPHIFQTNFWYMWETTFAFRTQSSAQELRRYMHQMIYEFTQIEHLVGVNRTRYNQYESIMLPLIKYLEGQGCNFVMNRRVTDFEFKDTPMQDEIMDSVINCIPVYMPYASALFNNRAKSDRPEVIPKHSTNLAFTGEFVEQPYQMVFTEQSAVRSGEVAAFHFAGVSEAKLVKNPRFDKDPRVLLRATKRMFE